MFLDNTHVYPFPISVVERMSGNQFDNRHQTGWIVPFDSEKFLSRPIFCALYFYYLVAEGRSRLRPVEFGPRSLRLLLGERSGNPSKESKVEGSEAYILCYYCSWQRNVWRSVVPLDKLRSYWPSPYSISAVQSRDVNIGKIRMFNTVNPI